MKQLLTISLCLLFAFNLQSQTRQERKATFESQFNYEVICLGVGQDGTKMIKVWGYGKKPEDAAFNAKKNVVAAALFRGVPGGNGAAPTPAIVDMNAFEENVDFFNDFFKAGGLYLNYVNVTTDGAPSGDDRIKMSKGYKVAISASVDFNRLRSYLEEKGIARKLDAGF